MNQIAEIPRPTQSEQAGREQVGEVLAAWPVVPGALLLLGWQETVPPADGMAQLERRRADRGPFRCLTWPRTSGSHAFLAAVRLPPATDPLPGQLLVLHGTETLPLVARLPAAFDPAPAFAESAARLAGPHGGSVARFLCDMFPAAALSRLPALGGMLAAFLDRVCADDGCVELTGSVPDGCTFLQGWGRPHPDADGDVVLVGERVSRHALQAARFDRPDIVAPSTGSLLVLPPDAAADLPGLTQLYLLTDQGVWRRKLVERRVLGADESASHLRAMLPSLRCPPRTADCLRASLKPRFEGRDTLHDRGRPVRAGIDLAVAAGGGCYLTGWLFDPASLVAELHLHGGAFPPSGVRLDTAWTRVARMDVTDAFAAEPTLPRPQHHDHGFAAFAPPAPNAGRTTPLHLAATFRDGHIAFLPLAVCDAADAAVRSRMLASVDLHKPSGLAVIERQLGPAFHALKASHGAAEIVFTTAPRPNARHAIVVPLLDEPALPRMVLSQFLTDRLADDETLVLVCAAAWGAAKLDELRRRLAFCGLPAVVLHAPAATGVPGALAMAAAATRADDFLLLGSATAGASPGWRAALRAGALAHGPLACACPTLLYEDWSIRWAGSAAVQTLDTAPYVAVRQERAGLPAASVGGVAADVSTLGTFACCLISRPALALVAGGAARITPFGQETGFFLSLAAAGVACHWVPAAQAYAVDDATERPAEPSVGRLIDGWCLREDLHAAGHPHTHEHNLEMAACAS